MTRDWWLTASGLCLFLAVGVVGSGCTAEKTPSGTDSSDAPTAVSQETSESSFDLASISTFGVKDLPSVVVDLPDDPDRWAPVDEELVSQLEAADGYAMIGLKAPSSPRLIDTGVRAAISASQIRSTVNDLVAEKLDVLRYLSYTGAVRVRMPPESGPRIRALPMVDFLDPRSRTGKPATISKRRVSAEEVMKYSTLTHDGQLIPWGIDSINAPMAWGPAGDNQGQGATIGILDTGLDTDHEDLVFPWLGCDGPPGTARLPCQIDSTDAPRSHGTHVAGIAIGRDNSFGIVGVAPGVDDDDFFFADVCNPDCTDDWISESLDKATGLGAKTVNISINIKDDPTVASAVAYAWDNDVVLVASLGNGDDITEGKAYPAKYSQVIAVSGVDEDLSSTSSTDFSCESKVVHGFVGSGNGTTETADWNDIAAPAWAVSTVEGDNYDIMCGTSMAAPYVAGTVALMRAACPLVPNDQVRSYLLGSARDLGDAGWDPVFGEGLVNARQAVNDIEQDSGC